MQEGAFDEAVKDVDAIEHTASPFHFRFKEPDELLVPAVKGTVGILESAKKYGYVQPSFLLSRPIPSLTNVEREL